MEIKCPHCNSTDVKLLDIEQVKIYECESCENNFDQRDFDLIKFRGLDLLDQMR